MTRTPVLVLVLALVAIVLAAAWSLGPSAEFEEEFDALSSTIPADVESGVEPFEGADEDAVVLDRVAHEPSEREVIAFATDDARIEQKRMSPASWLEHVQPGSLLARGRVVDAASGEALASYGLELQDTKLKRVRVLTDADGRFTATVALAPGPLEVRAMERSREFDPGLAAELRPGEDGNALEIELRVETGPTFRLAISPVNAPPADQMTATLHASSDRGPLRARGTIGGGTEPWVRFAPLAGDASEGEIILDSLDGVWRGRANVRLGRGIHRGVVPVLMESLAALEVRVVGADDRPLARATVGWKPSTGRRVGDKVTRDNGTVEWARTAAEAGVLSVRLTRYLDHEMPLVLAQGVRRVETVKLVRAPSAGSIRGTVISDTGSFERGVDVRLVPFPDGRGAVSQLSAKVEWSQVDGAKVGRFAFDDLPVGRWTCHLSEDDWYLWEPRRFEVETPRGDLVFVVRDAVPVADLEFEPRSENGAVFSNGIEVRLLVKGEPRLYRGRDGRVLVPSFPVDSPLRWRIDSAGRATVFGGWTDLAPLTSVGGRERRGAAPILESGWSQTFRVVRHDNSKAVAGAKAIVDGRESGVTGADGRIVLRAESKPKRVQFRFKDWKMRGNANLAPANGSAEFESLVRLEVPKNARKK